MSMGDNMIPIVSDLQHHDDVINSIANARLPPPPSARIRRVPEMVNMTHDDYDKYYVPKVVSIGPYHSGNQKLESIEKLKPVFTMKLLSDDKGKLRSLYTELLNMVQELRSFYEEGSTEKFCDSEFVTMMLLDGCFIWYYIRFIFDGNEQSCPHLKNHQIAFLPQDFFLLENQIPFKVLKEVSKLIDGDCYKIESFLKGNVFAWGRPKRSKLCGLTNYITICKEETKADDHFSDDHLLQFLHRVITQIDTVPAKGIHKDVDQETISRWTFRNVNELIDVGIRFKPSSIMSLAHIEYSRTWWWFFADVKLPPITVDDSTKPMLLNLVAHEMCSDEGQDAWVTSYICLLDSLIDRPEDVQALRKACILDNSLGSDEEVVNLFNNIGTDLVPNSLAYSKAKTDIQRHYETLMNTRLSQLKHEYVKSPWAFLALLGAVLALVLSGVQTYFTVWSPESPCDGLCKFLKTNHHL